MKSTDRLFALALIVTIALRIVLIALPGADLRQKVTGTLGDSPEYARLAANLAKHRAFSLDSAPPLRPDLFRTPGYPLFLAPFFAAFRSPLLWVVLAQMVLSLGIAWATRLLARELGIGERPAVLAALAVGLSPNLAFVSTLLATETLFTLLLVVTLVLLNRFRCFGRRIDLLAAGTCLGLLILTRPIATFLPLALAAGLLLSKPRSIRMPLLAPLVLLAATAVIITPWLIRNGHHSGRYIISTVSERNTYLYSGALTLAAARSIPLAKARDSMLAETEATYGPLDSTDEASYWAALGRTGWRHILARPLLAARIHAAGSTASLTMPLGIRPLLIYTGVENLKRPDNPHVAQQFVGLLARGRAGAAVALAWRERLARLPAAALGLLILAALFNAGLLLLALAGLLRNRNRRLLWLLVPTGYLILLTGPVGEARFRAPVEPLLAVFAAATLAGAGREENEPAAR